jgi:hypothetical protein
MQSFDYLTNQFTLGPLGVPDQSTVESFFVDRYRFVVLVSALYRYAMWDHQPAFPFTLSSIIDPFAEVLIPLSGFFCVAVNGPMSVVLITAINSRIEEHHPLRTYAVRHDAAELHPAPAFNGPSGAATSVPLGNGKEPTGHCALCEVRPMATPAIVPLRVNVQVVLRFEGEFIQIVGRKQDFANGEEFVEANGEVTEGDTPFAAFDV